MNGIKILLIIHLYIISIILLTQKFITNVELNCIDAVLGFNNNTNLCTTVYTYGNNIQLGILLFISTTILTYIIFKKGE